MKRLLNADQCFFAIVDAESRIIGCSSSALIRCATLDLIARNNQARIPLFFKEEREIQIYLDLLHSYKRKFCYGDLEPAIDDLLNSTPDNIKQALFDTIYSMLESERKKIFHRKSPPIKHLINRE